MVVPSPAGGRANSTLLDSRGWGTLLSRARTGLAGEMAGVPPDGRISGTHEENPYSLLEISTVERGVVSLFGVKSALFVAMNSKGRLYTTPSFQEECKFRETLLPNNYNAYESDLYRGTYIALSKYGRVKRGSKDSPSSAANTFIFDIPLYLQTHPSIDRSELSKCELKKEIGKPGGDATWPPPCPADTRVDVC
ncbi:Fibroblast growth factor 6 [Manis javanica]|nr:Fibroblast growth factor 6 [Manis javanica]